MTPDALGVVKAGLEDFCKEIFDAARKGGFRESAQAYMADALVAMALASTKMHGGTATRAKATSKNASGEDDTPDPVSEFKEPQARKPLLRVRVDLGALLRGHVLVGETCSIPGVGELPVELVRELIPNAVLELVITNGTDVTTVVTDSRYIRKALRLAVRRARPDLLRTGLRCFRALRDRSLAHRRGFGRADRARQSGPTVQAAPPSKDPQRLAHRGRAGKVAICRTGEPRPGQDRAGFREWSTRAGATPVIRSGPRPWSGWVNCVRLGHCVRLGNCQARSQMRAIL